MWQPPSTLHVCLSSTPEPRRKPAGADSSSLTGTGRGLDGRQPAHEYLGTPQTHPEPLRLLWAPSACSGAGEGMGLPSPSGACQAACWSMHSEGAECCLTAQPSLGPTPSSSTSRTQSGPRGLTGRAGKGGRSRGACCDAACAQPQAPRSLLHAGCRSPLAVESQAQQEPKEKGKCNYMLPDCACNW